MKRLKEGEFFLALQDGGELNRFVDPSLYLSTDGDHRCRFEGNESFERRKYQSESGCDQSPEQNNRCLIGAETCGGEIDKRRDADGENTDQAKCNHCEFDCFRHLWLDTKKRPFVVCLTC